MEIRLIVGTGIVGCEHEKYVIIPDDKFNKMTSEERNEYFGNLLKEMVNDRIRTSWEVVE